MKHQRQSDWSHLDCLLSELAHIQNLCHTSTKMVVHEPLPSEMIPDLAELQQAWVLVEDIEEQTHCRQKRATIKSWDCCSKSKRCCSQTVQTTIEVADASRTNKLFRCDWKERKSIEDGDGTS